MGIDCEHVAVAKVLWVSDSKMWLWLRFWGSRNQKKTIGDYYSNAKRSASFLQEVGPGPRRGLGEVLLLSFQFTVYSYQLTGGDR